jgi:hypothetical protein
VPVSPATPVATTEWSDDKKRRRDKKCRRSERRVLLPPRAEAPLPAKQRLLQDVAQAAGEAGKNVFAVEALVRPG